MRAIAFLISFSIFASTAGAWSDWSHKYNEDKPIAGERGYILRIFDFYSQIQQNFEKSGYSARSRDLLEDYTSAMLLPACASCAKLLSRGHDIEVMLAYFRLLRFTRKSASESFGLYLAEIFVANPTLIEDAFRQLTPEQKCTGFGELSWGFGNVTYGKTPSAANKRLEERLIRMKPSCK
jgi:hypothetical protein